MVGGCTGRNDMVTPYRHHIRTIHTRDNDYAGVTIESGMSTTATSSQSWGADGKRQQPVNPHAHRHIWEARRWRFERSY